MSQSAADTAPILKEWMTGSEVADALGISRQHVNRMFNRGEFTTLHRLGDRPILVVQTTEVQQKASARTEAAEEKVSAQAEALT